MNIDSIFAHLLTAQQELTHQQQQAFLTRVSQLMREKAANLLQSTEPTPGILLSTIQANPVQWLWPNRIPLGTITILEGQSGVGTSLLALTIAAAVSSGSTIFNSPSSSQGRVLLITPDPNIIATLRPRLETADSNLSQITLLATVKRINTHNAAITDSPFSLPTDFPLLEEAVISLSPSLVIIDPLALVMRERHSIPETLTRLADLAQRANCAILLVRHLTSSSIPTLSSSAAQILRLIQHPDDDRQRILTSIKNTLTPTPNDLTLQIIAPTPGIPTFQLLEETPRAARQSTSSSLSQHRQAILWLLQDTPHPLTPTEIAHLTGIPYEPLRILLSRMTDAGEITRPARGEYTSLQMQPSLNPETPSASTSSLDTSETSETSETNDTTNRPDTSETSETNDTFRDQDTIDTSDTFIIVDQFTPIQLGSQYSPYT